jgi:hypothetical protein
VFPRRVTGRVTSVSGTTVVVSNRKGGDTVLVSPSTRYFEKGTTPTGVRQGELVSAFGLPDSTTPGDLDAQVVAIFGPQQPQPQPQPQAPAPVTPSQPQPEAQPQPVGPTTGADNRAPHAGPAPQPGVPQAGGPVTTGRSGHAQGAPSPTHGSWGGHGGPGGPGGSGGSGGHH